MDQSFQLTTDDLDKSKEKAFAKAVLTKKLTNGKKGIEMNTTHTKEPTEQKEKPKGGKLLETIDLRDYFAGQALASINLGIGVTDAFYRNTAKHCYALADAMLKAREA
jgi:hypothetical protein